MPVNQTYFLSSSEKKVIELLAEKVKIKYNKYDGIKKDLLYDNLEKQINLMLSSKKLNLKQTEILNYFVEVFFVEKNY
jgi:hypothetical protein